MLEDLESSPYLGWVIELQLVPLTSGVLVDLLTCRRQRSHCGGMSEIVSSTSRYPQLPLFTNTSCLLPPSHSSQQIPSFPSCTLLRGAMSGYLHSLRWGLRGAFNSRRGYAPLDRIVPWATTWVSSVWGDLLKNRHTLSRNPLMEKLDTSLREGKENKGASIVQTRSSAPVVHLPGYDAASACSVCRRASQQLLLFHRDAGGIWFWCQHGN